MCIRDRFTIVCVPHTWNIAINKVRFINLNLLLFLNVNYFIVIVSNYTRFSTTMNSSHIIFSHISSVCLLIIPQTFYAIVSICKFVLTIFLVNCAVPFIIPVSYTHLLSIIIVKELLLNIYFNNYSPWQ